MAIEKTFDIIDISIHVELEKNQHQKDVMPCPVYLVNSLLLTK